MKNTCWAWGFTLLVSLPAWGAIVTFSGFDPGAGPISAHPNASAAAAAFDAAAGSLPGGGGSVTINTLENLAATNALNVAVDAVMTFQFSNHSTGFQTIRDANFDSANGYNTTPGGTKWALIFPDNSGLATQLDFVFSSPIQAWGTFHTGLGSVSAAVAVEFNDGSSNSFPLSGSSTGGAGFFGFTDSGKSITKVSWVVRPNPTSGDSIGIDDVRYVLVPEPGCGVALAATAVGLLFTRRQTRRAASATALPAADRSPGGSRR